MTTHAQRPRGVRLGVDFEAKALIANLGEEAYSVACLRAQEASSERHGKGLERCCERDRAQDARAPGGLPFGSRRAPDASPPRMAFHVRGMRLRDQFRSLLSIRRGQCAPQPHPASRIRRGGAGLPRRRETQGQRPLIPRARCRSEADSRARRHTRCRASPWSRRYPWRTPRRRRRPSCARSA